MKTESKLVTVSLVNGLNYLTLKNRCQMALMKERLWNIANGSDCVHNIDDENRNTKFMARRQCSFATIVLFGGPSSRCLIGSEKFGEI